MLTDINESTFNRKQPDGFIIGTSAIKQIQTPEIEANYGAMHPSKDEKYQYLSKGQFIAGSGLSLDSAERRWDEVARTTPTAKVYKIEVQPSDAKGTIMLIGGHDIHDASFESPEMYNSWLSAGYNVVAIRYPEDVREYDNNLDIAEFIVNCAQYAKRELSGERCVIAGHSTGGVLLMREMIKLLERKDTDEEAKHAIELEQQLPENTEFLIMNAPIEGMLATQGMARIMLSNAVLRNLYTYLIQPGFFFKSGLKQERYMARLWEEPRSAQLHRLEWLAESYGVVLNRVLPSSLKILKGKGIHITMLFNGADSVVTPTQISETREQISKPLFNGNGVTLNDIISVKTWNEINIPDSVDPSSHHNPTTAMLQILDQIRQ